MSKKGLIIILSLVAVAGGTAIYFVLRNEKKKVGPGEKPDTPPPPPPPNTSTGATSSTGTLLTKPKEPQPKPEVVNYDKHPKIQELNEHIGRVDYALEIMCKGTKPGEVVHCKSKSVYDPGLVQGSWIMFQRQLKSLQKAIVKETPTDQGAQKHGLALINHLATRINNVMDPKYFNQNQQFYKDYVKTGATPIPV
jgi:hypothetical protein